MSQISDIQWYLVKKNIPGICSSILPLHDSRPRQMTSHVPSVRMGFLVIDVHDSFTGIHAVNCGHGTVAVSIKRNPIHVNGTGDVTCPGQDSTDSCGKGRMGAADT